MKQTVNERIMLLKKESEMTDIDFCQYVGISTGTLHRIRNGEKVSSKVIELLLDATTVKKEWLLKGTGEMKEVSKEEIFPGETSELDYLMKKKTSAADIWKDATYKSMSDQISMLKALVKQLSKGELNFHDPLTESSSKPSTKVIELLRDEAA